MPYALCLAALLAACGGVPAPLSPGDRIPNNRAVIVGRIVLNPVLDAEGDVTKNDFDPMQPVAIGIMPTGAKMKDFEQSGLLFDGVETNKFFALPIETNAKKTVTNLDFYIARKKWYSSTGYHYHSYLRKMQFKIDQNMKNGNVYAFGTITIKIAPSGFKEGSKSEVNQIIPESISYTADMDAATEWFNDKFPQADREVAPLNVMPVESNNQNEFKQESVTTYYK